MGTRDKRRTVSTMAVAVLLLAGCGPEVSTQDIPTLKFDQAMDTAIAGVAKNGEPVLVRDITIVKWDEIVLFTEGAAKPKIEDVVGESGLHGRYMSSTNLLVFRDAGEVVALIGTSPDVFTGEYGVLFGPEAVLTPDEAWDGYVRLTAGN